MSSTVSVFIANQPAEQAAWKASSAAIMSEQGATIYLGTNEADNLRKVQKAGRQLDTMGIKSVQLAGEGWDLERQWAFSNGFTDTLTKNTIQWADDADKLTQMRDTAAWVRELINLPPNEIYPESLAQKVTDKLTAVAPNAITVTQIVGDELVKHGRMGIHTVGRASKKPPVMLVVDYNPGQDANAAIDAVLIGKGITFDSGGYSIKSSEGMLAMKCDMGGAATVAGALVHAIHQGLNKRVQLVLCCAENLIDGSAYKLGDIITYKNGQTVEIVNTDAEGRLVLADGLIYAGEVNAKLIIDAATLTGAAQVAVGTDYNALFSVDDELAQKTLNIAHEQRELLWRLPLNNWHKDNCPSAFADTANSRPQKGGGSGGASNAAGFLLRFAPNEGAGWLHFDIAGAYHGSANALWPTGATALGFRTIAASLLK
ncbi:aminopeptidase PepB [Pseudidiomarina donghaiensis]|uniref:Aminopeptidase PepB n=1 Tax=Pseudidiomarina donghaiensis TaxID=519452 RepID=A0A432XFM3_9GAMM|nr:aminopeptidase PepB [Pseudidiomarina donghaiensis]RUO47412.1 aminopeptidase PepB [Pseudidiomarina donghaiensis]SFV22996.1 PepB aminopeptidase [Pseudidiomarina donghaiensis]